MEALLWVLLPGFVALASGLLAWFVMQSRMEVALAEQRTTLAEERGALHAERSAVQTTFHTALEAAQERARREAFDGFLSELTVEQRHYTRENRLLLQNRRSLVLQERIFFRNIPLSNWVEQEIPITEGADLDMLARTLSVFSPDVLIGPAEEDGRHRMIR